MQLWLITSSVKQQINDEAHCLKFMLPAAMAQRDARLTLKTFICFDDYVYTRYRHALNDNALGIMIWNWQKWQGYDGFGLARN